MKCKIDLPVGTRFKVKVNNRVISVEVIESDDCEGCVFHSELKAPCPLFECTGGFRVDLTPVIFKGN